MVEVKPLRLGRWKMSSYVFSEILPVWSLISLMCVCVGKLWGGFSPDNNTSDAENSFRPELWLAVFAAWVGLRRLCSARCGADLNGNVKCLVGLYACIIDKI